MIRRLQLAIESGDKTCFSEPGKPCRFVGATHFGTRPVCLLFRRANGREATLEEIKEGPRKGWLERLPECIEAEESYAELKAFAGE